MSHLEDNLVLLERRWPSLTERVRAAETAPHTWSETPTPAPVVGGKQLWSGWDRRGEAVHQAAAVPVGSVVAIVYGFGSGVLPELLLERAELQRLLVVPLSLPILRLALELAPVRWLEDPRVQIMHGSGLGSPWSADVPRCFVAGEMPHPDPDCARLRDELAIEISRRFQSLQLLGQRERDVRHYLANEATHGTDQRVSDLVASTRCRDERAIVVAGGPTVDDEIEWLRTQVLAAQPPTVICVGTALRTLFFAGLQPDVCVVIDTAESQLTQLNEVDPEWTRRITLVYERSIVPGFVSFWRGPRYWAHTGKSGDLWSDGTVLHASVDLAVQLGAKRVTLLGADFCYAYDRSHLLGCIDCQPTANTAGDQLVDGHGHPVRAIVSHTHMRRRLERYVAQRPGVRFTKRGRAGLPIEGVPWEE